RKTIYFRRSNLLNACRNSSTKNRKRDRIMLVLTRKTKEAIKIGDDIEIKVLAVQGDQVKIGIKAPRSVEVHRKELIEDVQLQNNEAANIPADYLVKLNQLYDNKKN